MSPKYYKRLYIFKCVFCEDYRAYMDIKLFYYTGEIGINEYTANSTFYVEERDTLCNSIYSNNCNIMFLYYS